MHLSVKLQNRNRTLLQDLGDWWTFLILVLLVAVFSITSPGFFSWANFLSTTVSASNTMILAVAETFVIITGGIDLSVGAILGLSGMVGADVMQSLIGQSSVEAMIAGIVAGLATGLILGAINGAIIAYLEITPFIATLGMLGIATGLTFLVTNGSDIVNIPTQFSNFGDFSFFNILGTPFLLSVGILLIAWFYLGNTRFGKYTYAIGSNGEGTRRSGVNVKRHLFKIYTLSGLLSGFAGVLIVARLATGSPLEGTNDELNAIAAVVIGGASLFGGRGTILASTVGALIISVLVSGLVIMGVQPYWQQVTIGIIIILAVYVDQRRFRNRALK